MKKGLILISAALLFVACGCNQNRYQSFLLHSEEIEHSNEKENKNSEHTGNNQENHEEREVTRRVLVDTRTGAIYYFAESNDKLIKFKP